MIRTIKIAKGKALEFKNNEPYVSDVQVIANNEIEAMREFRKKYGKDKSYIIAEFIKETYEIDNETFFKYAVKIENTIYEE